MDNNDIKLINDYENLIVLLRQLHNDTPILEQQHKSIKKAFVDAQEKLETTIATSDKKIEKVKKAALTDFEKECKVIISGMLSDFQEQATKILKDIELQKTELNLLLSKVDSAVTSLATAKAELMDGEIYSGKELIKNFKSHINKDLIVKRISPKSGKTWENDYCMFITEFDEYRLYGKIYLNGTLIKERTFYPIDNSFMIYNSPSKITICKNL